VFGGFAVARDIEPALRVAEDLLAFKQLLLDRVVEGIGGGSALRSRLCRRRQAQKRGS
jgi:hypothetical protein